jgi:peptide/nickel transport system permease protein
MSGIVLPAPRRAGLPAGVLAAMAWVVLILLVALLAEVLRPYSITALDLRARLPPRSGSAARLRIRSAPTNSAATC